MREYEVMIESINPCGGAAHSIRELREIKTDDPAAYVRVDSPYPVLCCGHNAKGDLTVSTGNDRGYRRNYTFTE